MFFRFRFAFVALFLIPTTALAELHNCDGVISDRPCSEIKPDQTTLSVVKKAVEDSDSRQKKSLIHDFTMKSLKARREHNIKTELKPTEDFCLLESTSVIDCQEKITALDDRLSQQLSEIQSLSEQKKANDLKEKENQILQERNKIEDRKKPDKVIIVQDRNIHVIQRQSPFESEVVVVRPHHHRHHKDDEKTKDQKVDENGKPVQDDPPQPLLNKQQEEMMKRRHGGN